MVGRSDNEFETVIADEQHMWMQLSRDCCQAEEGWLLPHQGQFKLT